MRQRAKRLPAETRRALILAEAAQFFSEHGFAASTRDLADRLGVRQALLYKYFESKEALIDAVFADAFDEHWTTKWVKILADGDMPLVERLKAFYSRYSDDPDNLRLRLFLRGALDGYPLTSRIGQILTKSFVTPLISELRREAGLADLSTRGLMAGERELVMLLHGAIVFHRMRQHIYKAPVADFEATTKLYIDVYLKGARASLADMHNEKVDDALLVSAA